MNKNILSGSELFIIEMDYLGELIDLIKEINNKRRDKIIIKKNRVRLGKVGLGKLMLVLEYFLIVEGI